MHHLSKDVRAELRYVLIGDACRSLIYLKSFDGNCFACFGALSGNLDRSR